MCRACSFSPSVSDEPGWKIPGGVLFGLVYKAGFRHGLFPGKTRYRAPRPCSCSRRSVSRFPARLGLRRSSAARAPSPSAAWPALLLAGVALIGQPGLWSRLPLMAAGRGAVIGGDLDWRRRLAALHVRGMNETIAISA